MLAVLWNILSFIVALGILVAVHEWGHFYVARRCGVKVLRFSIGFGKVLWRRTDKHGTEFAIAAIPLGGYVKMLDERVEDVPSELQEQSFNRKSVKQRFAIVAAGPIVNFLFAIIVLAVMYMIGVTTVKPVVGDVVENSIAQRAGLTSGMQITHVGERSVSDWEAVNLELVSAIGQSQVTIQVVDTGLQTTPTFVGSPSTPRFYDPATPELSPSPSEITLVLNEWEFAPDKQSAMDSLGFATFRPQPTMDIAYVSPESAASKAGLLKGDKILQIDGTLLPNWGQTVAYIKARPSEDIEMTIGRDGQIQRIFATLGVQETDSGRIGILGVSPVFEQWPSGLVFEQQHNLFSAVGLGIDKTWRLMTLSVDMIGKLFTGDVSVKSLSGPVSIAQGAGMSASFGLVYFLSFLALISVNLGIINLFPLPMLDGGHLMYYLIEWVTGKPVSEEVQEIGFRIGAVILFSLMSIAIFNDIMRIT
jgi:regulator of sigma E protease